MSDLRQAIQQLISDISGVVILPGDPNYEQASTVLFAKGTPALVVVPNTSKDVVKSVAFARKNKLALSLRNGGHSAAGHSTNDGGMVIDVRHFSEIKILDERQRLVRAGAGASWETVAKAVQPHGWAISSGDTKSVGVAGLTLAGGIGWLVRRDGLAIDNMVAAELITADGQLLRVSATEHADLFWALRGGGGNFGIVLSFDFAAHPVDDVFTGSIVYDLGDLSNTLRGWRDFMRTAPEELTSMFFIMPEFGGKPASAMVMLCHATAKEAEVMKTIEPLLKLGTVTHQDIQRKPYADALEDAHVPKDIQVIANNAFVKTLSDELIDTLCNNRNDSHMMQIRSLGGAMNRVSADATAFAHRDSEALIVVPTFVPVNASEEAVEKALTPWRKIEAFSTGAYCGLISEATDKILAMIYPGKTYEKLAQIKKLYDPENLFSQNFNIKPQTP